MAPKMGVENHTRAMNPRHGLVETDRASSFGFGHSGRTNSVIRGDEVQIPPDCAQNHMHITVGVAGTFPSRTDRSDQGGE